jgi:hypothetical protein
MQLGGLKPFIFGILWPKMSPYPLDVGMVLHLFLPLGSDANYEKYSCLQQRAN